MLPLTRTFLAIAAILGGTSVAAGAFASHALQEKLSERALEIFETATQYQMYHALALLGIALLCSRPETSQTLLIGSAVAFILGIALFSGSLYALSLTGTQWLGAITPLGGVAFLVGWGGLTVTAFRLR
ncbi:MAG: DUF423 domain-containing protein [Halothece sp. Uz-M2-17]|nr:DUF423 domain-containing protein [Halothece sp. Uz-M2-17]